MECFFGGCWGVAQRDPNALHCHHLSRLDLPDYPSEEVLRDKLLQAVGKKNKRLETGQQETSKSVTHKKHGNGRLFGKRIAGGRELFGVGVVWWTIVPKKAKKVR